MTELSFLGIIVDSQDMEYRLPEVQLQVLQGENRCMMGKHKIQLRQLQSLLGKLNFACRILPIERVCCRRFCAATAGVSSPIHYITLTWEHREGLHIWHAFLDSYNGRALWMEDLVSNFDMEFYTDAAGLSD